MRCFERSRPAGCEHLHRLQHSHVCGRARASTARAFAALSEACSERHQIFFLWRPLLRDPKDDLVLELAVKARCDFIVTYNTRDFVGCERFDLAAITPAELLENLGDPA